MLGVRASWLATEADAGRIPALRAGDRWLCDPSAVEAELLRRARELPAKTTPTSEKGGP